MFGMKEIKAVVGTNSWGSKVYGKLLRGSYVDSVYEKDYAEDFSI